MRLSCWLHTDILLSKFVPFCISNASLISIVIEDDTGQSHVSACLFSAALRQAFIIPSDTHLKCYPYSVTWTATTILRDSYVTVWRAVNEIVICGGPAQYLHCPSHNNFLFLEPRIPLSLFPIVTYEGCPVLSPCLTFTNHTCVEKDGERPFLLLFPSYISTDCAATPHV